MTLIYQKPQSEFISQSALSQFISNYEKRKNITLFQRKSNRLVGLTESGKIVYQYALEIVDKYEEMTQKAPLAGENYRSIIKIGVPSLILMVFFSSFLPKLKEKYPHYEFKMVEAGSKQIQEWLTLGELDIGIILGPVQLDDARYIIHPVHSSEVVAYIDYRHPLSERNN
ncbi:LysR family transcriptional regulator [Aerococcaceae bacterium DSM 111020]|nr:LysR family transcriptional regulator [Aerococcaceae bacterium DSM 111020]